MAKKQLSPAKQRKAVDRAVKRNKPNLQPAFSLPEQASDRAREATAVRGNSGTRPVVLVQETPDFIPPTGERSIDGGWMPQVTFEDGSQSGLAPDWSNAVSLLGPRNPELDAYLAGISGNVPGYYERMPPIPPSPLDEPNELNFWDRLMRVLQGR